MANFSILRNSRCTSCKASLSRVILTTASALLFQAPACSGSVSTRSESELWDPALVHDSVVDAPCAASSGRPSLRSLGYDGIKVRLWGNHHKVSSRGRCLGRIFLWWISSSVRWVSAGTARRSHSPDGFGHVYVQFLDPLDELRQRRLHERPDSLHVLVESLEERRLGRDGSLSFLAAGTRSRRHER